MSAVHQPGSIATSDDRYSACLGALDHALEDTLATVLEVGKLKDSDGSIPED